MKHNMLLFVVSMVLLASNSYASKERILALSNFRVESTGVGESGAVVVTGSQTSSGIASIRVDAFGKSFLLSKNDLEKLQGVIVNGIQISYEAGYQDLGGRTIYLLLATGFTSGVPEGKLVSITERGDIRIENAARPQ